MILSISSLFVGSTSINVTSVTSVIWGEGERVRMSKGARVRGEGEGQQGIRRQPVRTTHTTVSRYVVTNVVQ